MPQYRVLGDVLVPGEVLVEADSPSEAVEKSTDSKHWLDHQLYETHKPHCLGFQPTEAAERI